MKILVEELNGSSELMDFATLEEFIDWAALQTYPFYVFAPGEYDDEDAAVMFVDNGDDDEDYE